MGAIKILGVIDPDQLGGKYRFNIFSILGIKIFKERESCYLLCIVSYLLIRLSLMI